MRLLRSHQSGSAASSYLLVTAMVALSGVVGLAPMAASLEQATLGSSDSAEGLSGSVPAVSTRALGALNHTIANCDATLDGCHSTDEMSGFAPELVNKGLSVLAGVATVAAGVMVAMTFRNTAGPHGVAAALMFIGLGAWTAFESFRLWRRGSEAADALQLQDDHPSHPSEPTETESPIHGVGQTVLGSIAGAASAYLIQFGPWGVAAAAVVSGMGLWLAAQAPRSFRDTAVSYSLGLFGGALLSRVGLLPSKSAFAAGGTARVVGEATAGVLSLGIAGRFAFSQKDIRQD